MGKVVSIYRDELDMLSFARVSTDGCKTWSALIPIPDNDYRDAAYNGEVFCFVANALSPDHNFSIVTPDGNTWQTSAMPYQENGDYYWHTIAWNGSVFCTITESSSSTGVAVSADNGQTWTRGLMAHHGGCGLAARTGLFVTVDSANPVTQTSVNGLEWVAHPGSLSTASWNVLAYNGTVFCSTCMGSGVSAATPDGINWSEGLIKAGVGNWFSLASNGSIFCAVSGSDAAISNDGVSWTVFDGCLPPGASNYWMKMVWDGAVFCAFSQLGDVITSPDGKNWTKQPSVSGLIFATAGVDPDYIPPPKLMWVTQPSVLSPIDGGGIIAYGTADVDAEDVYSAVSASVSVSTSAIFRDAASTLIAAGASASDTRQMIESVLSAATVTTTTTAVLQSVEQALADIEAFPTVADLLTLAQSVTDPFIFTAQPSLSMQTGDGGIIAYGTADTGADDVASSADVSAQVTDLLTRVEQLLTTVQAVPSVADLMAQVELITVTAQGEASALDTKLSGVAESLLSAATGLATVADVQMMVNGVTSVALATGDITAVANYVANVGAAITAKATVSDMLITLLAVGPHVTITLLSTINMKLDMLSPIQRAVYLNSPARIN